MTPLVVAQRKAETIRSISRDLDAALRDTSEAACGPLVAVLLRLRSALDGLDEALSDQADEHAVRMIEFRDDVENALADEAVITGEELDLAVAAVAARHEPVPAAPGRCSCGSIYATSDAYAGGLEEWREHLAGSALDQVPAEPLTLDDLLPADPR